MNKRPTDPYICTNAEREAVNYVIHMVSKDEPCAVVGMNGSFGKELLCQEITEQLKKIYEPESIVNRQIFEQGDIDKLDKELEIIRERVVVVVEWNETVSKPEFWKYLENLRKKHRTNFVSVVVANVGDVKEELLQGNLLVCRGLWKFIPLREEDEYSLVASFEARFNTKLSKDERKQIWELSGGNMGLTKSLFLTKVDDVKSEAIRARLQGITSEFKEIREDKILLENFGYTRNGKMFSPLWEEYLKELGLIKGGEWKVGLSASEIEIIELLETKIGQIISREEIAEVIWKEKWQEKYSDWAIDQLIHRLRDRLVKLEAEFRLETKKGRGIMLVRN